MYICTQCNHIFEEGEQKVIKENQGECFGYPAFETYSVCPLCGETYEEAVRCSICEEYHLEEDLTNGICDECLDREVDYDKVLRFLLDTNELKSFVFDFFFTTAHFGDGLEKAINDELTCWFKRKVFDEKLNNKTEFLDILKKYTKTDPYGWSEFLSEGGDLMGNTSLGVRMITYRARHRLSQRAFANLIGETLATVFRIENGIHKPHKINEIRLTEKMDKLEAEERGEA